MGKKFDETVKKLVGKMRASRQYEGARYNRLSSDWVAGGTSQDSELLSSLRTLRNRSRELCRNNDYAKGAIRTISNNIIGKGIQLQSIVTNQRGGKLNDAINSKIEAAWMDWGVARYCHTEGKLDFPEIERVVLRSIIESGEVLVRLITQSFDGSPIPLALEILESDHLVDEYSAGNVGENNVRMGIEVDRWRRPIAYWLYPHHPGDYQFLSGQTGGRLNRIPANEIIHLYIYDRPGQTRGVPWFSSALMRLRNIGGYEEAELIAARAQASVMGFIQTPDGDLLGDGVEGANKLSSLEPGAIEVLAPGETFAGFAPTRPDAAFDPFVRMMLRGVAAGIGLSYESLSKDYSNTSYSSARTALLDERDCYRVIQGWLSSKFHQIVFEKWLELAVLSNSISLPNYFVNPAFYQKPKWIARGWQWVDPQNEVAAFKEGIKSGFTTISQVAAQSGLDFEDIIRERRREIDLAKEAGLFFDTTVPSTEKPKPQVKEGLSPARFFLGMTPVGLRLEARAKKCVKGISCGNSCIAANKTCSKTLTPGTTKKAKELKEKKKKEAPKKEVPKKEVPKKEVPKKEVPKKEVPKKEVPKKTAGKFVPADIDETNHEQLIAEGQRFLTELGFPEKLKPIKQLEKDHAKQTRELQQALNENRLSYPEYYAAYEKLTKEKIARIKEEQAVYTNVLNTLKSRHKNKSAEAARLAENIAINIDSRNIRQKDVEKIRRDLKEFHLLTGLNTAGTYANIDVGTVQRSRANVATKDNTAIGSIFLRNSDKQVFFHELGHEFESMYAKKNFAEAAINWRNSRTTSEKPVALRKTTGNSAYNDDEVAYKGKFINSYVGRVYDRDITEVISMGLEHFGEPSKLKELKDGDSEHFEFMVGILTRL